MARIVILGSGVIGMSIASYLGREHDITIVARNLPGDEPSIEWASPWAGAIFVAGGCAAPREKQMQMDAFSQLWRWTETEPESSLKKVTMEDIIDTLSPDEIWWKHFMPEFRFLSREEMPRNARLGISYKSVVCNPLIFLPWLRKRLESRGVRFERKTLESLSDADAFEPDVVVNATGVGSESLGGVRDGAVEVVRGQTIVCRSDYDKLFMRDDGKDYTYAIARGDGTVIAGGIRQPGVTDSAVDWDICKDIVRRIHQELPSHFPADISKWDIVGHNVGLRPSRTTGIRVEKEIKNDRKIVHAYGFGGGGYVHSFGVARVVRGLVDELLFPSVTAKL